MKEERGGEEGGYYRGIVGVRACQGDARRGCVVGATGGASICCKNFTLKIPKEYL